MTRGLRHWHHRFQGNKGSAGIESILWGIGFLLILVMPFLCFLYEQYAYSLEQIQASSAISQSLERIQYYVSTEELSTAKVVVKREQFEEALKEVLIEKLKCSEKTRKLLALRISYGENTSVSGFKDSECRVFIELGIVPATFVGSLVAETNGLISMALESQIVLPINR